MRAVFGEQRVVLAVGSASFGAGVSLFIAGDLGVSTNPVDPRSRGLRVELVSGGVGHVDSEAVLHPPPITPHLEQWDLPTDNGTTPYKLLNTSRVCRKT